MSIFLLPKIIHNVCDENNVNDVDFTMTKDNPSMFISHSLYNSLCEAKIKIEQNDIAWDNCKKILNPYEFIHTVIPGYKTQVSKMTPLSRSFYKMIEMSTIFNLCYKNENNENGIGLNENDIGLNENGIGLNENVNCLLADYIHNLSSRQILSTNANLFNHMKDIEWYVHENYYYDVCSGTHNGNDESKSDDYFNNHNINNNDSAFELVKNKNIFFEKKEKCIKANEFVKCREITEKLLKNEKENYLNDALVNDAVLNNAVLNDAVNNFKSFHLAEGPGGFIEAVSYLRKNKTDEYYGMTLMSSDVKCPGWKKSKKFLEDNSNVIIEKGVDETGNLLSRENFMHCYKKYKHKMNLVTGDGGVDFSEDFNNQEHTAIKLVIAQIAYGLAMQKNNGNFILKVFDTFSNTTIDILYLLSSLYKHVYIMKPQTSRYANSERYIICKGFGLDENKKRIDNIIQKIYDNFDNLNSNLYIETIFNFKCSRSFISKIEEINIIIGKRQIDNIVATLNLMSNKSVEKVDYYKKKHIQKCIKWCEKYNIQFHKNIKTTNVFLTPCIHSHSYSYSQSHSQS